MKAKIYNYLSKPYIVVLTMLIAPLMGYIDRNFVLFFGLTVASLILWGSNFNWSKFGFEEKISMRTVLRSLLITAVLIIGFDIIIDPILKTYLGKLDLSSINDIRGNFGGYIVLMVIMWIFAAFGEEFLFRGYYMKALAELLGGNNKSWVMSAIITSTYFGISHAYQGIVGIVSVFLWSLCISMIFNRNRNNLLLLVLVHGLYDTIGLTLIFLNQDGIFSDWILKLFST